MFFKVIPRATWGAAPPKSWTFQKWVTGGVLYIHHTAGATVQPEPAPPPKGHEGIVWVGDSYPNMKTLQRRHPLTPLEVRRAGDGRYVVVKVPEKRKVSWAEWKASLLKTEKAEQNAMREIQSFHQHTRGWSDIGYNYLVFPSGRVYEGRGFQVYGAHCPGHNHEPAVSFVGDFSSATPSKKAQMAVKELQKFLKASTLRGHGDSFPTSCPGNGVRKVML